MAEQQKITRKLRAILSADVKGYSRLMSDDESHTIKTLKEYRETMSEIIQQHSGRVVDAPGDNMLAEFSSIVNAIQSAVEIQKVLKQKNAAVPYNKKLEFRIGVNIGDVVQDGDSLYGEGVNIAARIESLADPGGVCISRGAYDHIRNKLNFGYKYIGEHNVKNIKDPVRVYKILADPSDAGKRIGDKPKYSLKSWMLPAVVVATFLFSTIAYQIYQKITAPEFEPASVEEMAFSLPEKPSIAVLAFDNMSDDPNQEFFCDGISEDIITALSMAEDLFVISRNSTFTYKGKPVKVKQVAEDLGVRYVLEGSVRKTDDRVRVTAQLIDALSGDHLWAERYDRDLQDIFALQDEITMKIVNALQVKLTDGEYYLMSKNRYKTLDVKLKSMEWYSLWKKGSMENLMRCGQVAQEIIDMAPEFEIGYNLLGWYYWALANAGMSPKESIAKAFELAQKALSLDESFPFAYSLLGNIYTMMRQHDKAIATAEKGVALYPNGSENHCALGITLSWAGRLDEAITHFKQAIRLDPFPQFYHYTHLSRCYMHKGEYEKALSEINKALHISPDSVWNLQLLAPIYALLDRQAEAKALVEKILEKDPNYSLERVSRGFPYKNKADLQFRLNAMRKAGFPEKSPLPLPEKPSVAVLPFHNMSGDPGQEYFSDGITEDIITALSKTPKMIVISRTSAFKYKNKSIKVQEIGLDLGARYVLEGSVRKDGTTVRITAQLIDAKTGHHMWSEKYDREQKNIFAVQDEITKKIITALQVKLTEGEQARIRSQGTDNLDVYLKVLEARELVRHMNGDDNFKAKQILQEAIHLDPNYAPAYRWLSSSHYIDTWLGATKSSQDSLKKAVALSKKALSINNSLGDAHALLGCIYVKQKQYDKSLPELEKAVELYPNGSDTLALVANQYLYLDKIEDAISLMNKAIEPFPIPPGWALNALAAMYRSKGDYKEALKWSEMAVKEQPNNFISHLNMCSIYSLMGRMDEAHQQAEEVLRLKPKFSVKKFEEGLPYKNIEVKNIFMNAVRNAGLPE